MELPKEKIKSNNVNCKRLVLYSPPKLGKTTAVSALENCLIVDLEQGSNFVEALKVQVNSLEELQELGVAIVKAGKPYKYVAIDTITKLEDWCEWGATEDYMATPIGKNFNRDSNNNLLPRGQWSSVLTLPNGGGYLYLRLAVSKWLEKIDKLADHIILIGHIKDKMIEKKGKEVTAKDIDLTGKIKSITCANADAIGYLYRDGDETHLNFNSSDETLCGARPEHLRGKDIIIGKLVEGKPVFDWSEIYK